MLAVFSRPHVLRQYTYHILFVQKGVGTHRRKNVGINKAFVTAAKLTQN